MTYMFVVSADNLRPFRSCAQCSLYTAIMHAMHDAPNLAAIDLNLLVALEALLAERHVTRAAARLGLSPPTWSPAPTS